MRGYYIHRPLVDRAGGRVLLGEDLPNNKSNKKKMFYGRAKFLMAVLAARMVFVKSRDATGHSRY